MLVSTTNIDKKYEVIDIVFAYGNSTQGFLKTANPMEAYPKVKEALISEAEKLSAEGIIGITFDYRVAVKSGCGSSSQVFEVFAYGTAIKFTK